MCVLCWRDGYAPRCPLSMRLNTQSQCVCTAMTALTKCKEGRSFALGIAGPTHQLPVLVDRGFRGRRSLRASMIDGILPSRQSQSNSVHAPKDPLHEAEAEVSPRSWERRRTRVKPHVKKWVPVGSGAEGYSPLRSVETYHSLDHCDP
jgi:hypothetical protein